MSGIHGTLTTAYVTVDVISALEVIPTKDYAESGTDDLQDVLPLRLA